MKLLLDVFGMLLIGDGLLSALHPRRHCRLWEVGPEPCKQLVDEFVKHPEMARAAGALELLLGVWLATREESWR
jgi:hypothetical protein